MGVEEPVTPASVAVEGPPLQPGDSRGRRRYRLAALIAWGGAVLAYQLWAVRSGVGPRESAVRLVDFLQGSAWGPVVLVAVYLVRPLLLLSAAVLTVAAGFLFGAGVGLAVVVVASNASAMIAYAVGRWFGKGAELRENRSRRLGRYAERMRTHSFETTLSLRLLFVPYDLVSYVAGFSRIRPVSFLAGTAIGSIPGTVAFVLFGASIERFDGGVPSIDWRTVSVSVGLLALSLTAVRIVRHSKGAHDPDA